jgi:hypothetical protein
VDCPKSDKLFFVIDHGLDNYCKSSFVQIVLVLHQHYALWFNGMLETLFNMKDIFRLFNGLTNGYI